MQEFKHWWMEISLPELELEVKQEVDWPLHLMTEEEILDFLARNQNELYSRRLLD